MKKIITISREFGAGGGEIGLKVANKLGFEYFDKELILQTAKSLNISPEKVVNFEEKVKPVFGFTQSLFDLYCQPLDEKLFAAQKSIIKQIAEKGNCVIVGRNANNVLSAFDNSLHVFISADKSWRVKRLKAEKLQNMPEEKIAAQMANIDKTRAKYCSYYSGTIFGQAQYYDLCLCSSSLGIEKCIEIICDLAKN